MELINNLCIIIMALCICAFFPFVIWLIISLIVKRNKKKPLIAIASCVVIFLWSTIIEVITIPETDDYATEVYETEDSEFQEKIEELEQIKENSSEIEKQNISSEKEDSEIKAQEEARIKEEQKLAEEKAKKEAEEKARLEEQKIENEKANDEIEEIEKSSKKFTYDDMDVEFLEYKIEENSGGEECLVLYFNFTNNTEENKTFIYAFSINAFQDGVALDSSMMHVNEETKNHSREIQPGTTIKVANAFVLSGNRNPIDIEIEPWISFDDKNLAEFIIEFE